MLTLGFGLRQINSKFVQNRKIVQLVVGGWDVRGLSFVLFICIIPKRKKKTLFISFTSIYSSFRQKIFRKRKSKTAVIIATVEPWHATQINNGRLGGDFFAGVHKRGRSWSMLHRQRQTYSSWHSGQSVPEATGSILEQLALFLVQPIRWGELRRHQILPRSWLALPCRRKITFVEKILTIRTLQLALKTFLSLSHYKIITIR